MKNPLQMPLGLLAVAAAGAVHFKVPLLAETTTEPPIFNTEEILDESTLEVEVIEDWHTDTQGGTTRQKLVEIKVAEWWPGKDYRIPVRMIVPLEGKAKGFHITGAHSAESIRSDSSPNAFDARLLGNGVGIVKTVVKPLNQIPGKRGLEQEMMRKFMKDFNPHYTTVWIWSMTLMRATTAAFAEAEHFEAGKVAGSGSSKNGISPAAALINDERFTATCSTVAFAWASPTRRARQKEMDEVVAANGAFFAAVQAGEIDIEKSRARWYRSIMAGSPTKMPLAGLNAGKTLEEIQSFADRILDRLSVSANWEELRERNADVFFEPHTHDYVAYDILWGAQNYPEIPTYYAANGGHKMQRHPKAETDSQNREAFLWHHFFGGEPLLSPPTSQHVREGDQMEVRVKFEDGPEAESGRLWWMVDRAPAGSAPFLHERIPDEQWVEMEQDEETGEWIATIPLEKGASHIDFFSNHGKVVNGYQQYLSSPYTRVELPLAGE